MAENRPLALRHVRIPSRSMQARQLVVQLYEACPHLGRPDLWTATRWADLAVKYRRMAELMDRLPEGGLVKTDMEPRKLLAELRGLAADLLRHEQALGITAAARAALGVDIAKLHDLASLMGKEGARG